MNGSKTYVYYLMEDTIEIPPMSEFEKEVYRSLDK